MATTTFNPNSPEQRYNVSGALSSGTILFWIDLGRISPEQVLSLHMLSIGTGGTITPEFSGDDVNWRAGLTETTDTAPALSSSSQTATLFLIPPLARYFRLRLSTAVSAGTTTAFLTAVGRPTLRTISLAGGTNNIGQLAAQAPNVVADVSSAAITTTSTTSGFTPTAGPSYSVNIPVTTVSGTSPTLDVGVEESDDGGTNWFRVYDFPRITASGSYRSPSMPLRGNRVRYVQTLGGTTPSFTRAINRVQIQDDTDPFRQIIDRTVNPNTLNAVTPTMVAQNCGNQVKVSVSLGAATTPPVIQLEGSDDNGVTWSAVGTAINAVASAVVVANVTGQDWSLYRARVSTAGVGATLNYVLIRAHS